MKRKRKITIILFAFSLVTLVVLQAYYIYNSYRLEEKELNRQARLIADKTLETMDRYENETNEEKLVGDFQRLKNGIVIQKEKITHPERIYNSEKLYNQKLEQELRKNIGNSGFEIALKSEIFSIVDEVKKQELLPANRSLILYQTVKKMSQPLTINEGKWSSRQSRENTDLKLNEKDYYLVRSRSAFQLLNLQELVIRKIVPLVIISLLIVILIIVLFRNSLRNLNRQEKKISQLHTTIDSIAHELNTPITTLKFSIAQSSDDETKTLLERQIRRLESIVSSIHKTDSEDVLISKQHIENYISEVKKTFDNIDFAINLNFTKNRSLNQIDFKQIMDNLIDNSAKYGATEIEISIEADKRIDINISDNGIGIPKDETKAIFQKYYRISREENRHVNGLGVGLYLVKNIVAKYKGDIQVFPLQRGVAFKITIPDEA